MNSFFWKIFLWFWLALGLIAAVGIFLGVFFAGQAVSDIHGDRAADLIREASNALERGGVESLRRWMRTEKPELAGMRVFIIDEQGDDLLGRQIPWTMRYRVRSLRKLQPREYPDNYRALRWAPSFVTERGEELLVVLAPRFRGPLGLFFLPTVPLGLLGVAVVITAAISLALARWFSAPVRNLQAVTRSLSAGNLSARVGSGLGDRRDELGQLGRDFDTMAKRLQRLLEGRQRLLRDISHELRSPLTRIRLSLGLARRKAAELDELNRMEQDLEKLDRLIDGVLKLARLDEAHSHPERVAVDVAAVLDEVVADARLEAETRQCKVARHGESHCTVQGDAELLRSAIENVLRNAVRHTAEGSTVEVDLARTGRSRVLITVRDHGPGVPESELVHLFEPFYRVSPAREHDGGGHGIGLAIAARVMKLHSGTIRARNVDEGGLEVALELPC